jgi:diguanylate cyclase (GGDEF)-like protein/PAS domain S-box-containing protein
LGQGPGRARQAARLLIAAGLFTIANSYLPGAGQLNIRVLNLIGLAAIILGLVAYRLPWHRWPHNAPIALTPAAFTLIALANRFGGVSHYSYATYFVLVFTWVGLAFPPRTSVLIAPVAAAAYVTPGLLTTHGPAGSVSSVTVTIPVCVLVAETIARTMRRVIAALEASHRQATALREAEERFRLAFTNAPIGVSLTSLDGRFVQVNEALCHMLGRTEGNLVDEPVRALTHPDDRAADGLAMQEMRDGRRTTFHTEKRYLRPDGAVVWVRLHAGVVEDDDGQPRYFISQMEDITERKQAEAALRASEARTRRILETAGDAFVAIDTDGRITDWNRQAEIVFGWCGAEVLGADLADLIIPDEHRAAHRHGFARYLADASPATTSRRMEVTAQNREGRRFPAEVTMWTTTVGGQPTVNAFVHDISERKDLEAQLIHQALHDPLTGLPNRSLFQDRLSHALQRCGRHGAGLAVLYLDLDGFKTVNDSLGHTAGDRLLGAVAERLRGALRTGDTIARLGGDEFAILLEETAQSAAVRSAERIQEALAAPFTVDGRQMFVRTSIGIAQGAFGTRAEDVLRNADVAMYRAKQTGKGNYALFESAMHAAAITRLDLEADLRRAISAGEIIVHYQPLVRLDDREMVGAEALVRWNRPGHGLIPPRHFIPVAEDTGLILDIGRHVLTEACRQVGSWRGDRGRPLRVSVNLSTRQLLDAGLVPMVERVIGDAGVDPAAVTLEITESMLIEDLDTTLPKLTALTDLGINLAIDDFGTGYSSLGYLRQLPVAMLKIDKSFVDRLDNPEDAALVRTIVDLGHVLRLTTVAEGIETEAQRRALAGFGCQLGQGYLFAPPLPPEQIRSFLAGGAATLTV